MHKAQGSLEYSLLAGGAVIIVSLAIVLIVVLGNLPGVEDKRCKTSCDDYNSCTADSCLDGNCMQSPITVCGLTADNCCPAGCDESSDADCHACTDAETKECTSGSCAGTQTCSGGSWGSCVKDDLCCGINCNDSNACTSDSCSAGVCSHTAIPGCGATCSDSDMQACTVGSCAGTQTCLGGSWGSCIKDDFCCGLTLCSDADGCCPAACDENTDSDCASCTTGETRPCSIDGCEGTQTCSGGSWGSCVKDDLCSGVNCDDSNACTSDNCSGGACSNEPVTSCTNGDGCCPSGCNSGTDNDCPALAEEIPRGIYMLDGTEGTCRDARILNYAFIDGYAWRPSWADIETSEGVYDFSKVDCILDKLSTKAPSQKLTIRLGLPGADCNFEPGYIAARASQTWVFTDAKSGHSCYNVPVTRAVPWDPYLQERFGLFMKALGDHVSLRDDTRLAQIGTVIPGLGHIRDIPEYGIDVSTMPGYSRNNFIAAIKNDLHSATDEFPNKSTDIGIWAITDDQSSPALWEDVKAAILGEFDGIKNPKIGFFQENLAASKDLATGVVTGYPSTAYAAPLYSAKDSTPILFQALTSWANPFTGSEKVANATPGDGMQYAYDTFNAAYFELYYPDLNNTAYRPELQYWHDKLQSP